MVTVEFERFNDAELTAFRRWQAVSYGVQAEVRAQLTPGVTERDATRWLMKAYRREGAQRYFHLPVALFGDRTALPDDPWTTESFFPTDRVLADGDSVILDAAPMFDGYLVDTSVSFSVGTAPEHAEALADNLRYRASILAAVRSGATFREIAAAVDEDMTARGDRNCHQLHPEGVLGHRVVRIPDTAEVPPADPAGFDPTLIAWFVRGITKAHTAGSSPPTWADQAISEHPPAPGLWAVEPHAGRGPVGVKWEELLVVEDRDAYWLDDDVPHQTA